MEQVILVDEHDVLTGTMEKMAAHEKAVLHRAFSVFIFNAQGDMLLQQRAKDKYHSGGLWTNSCCSHPRPGEETLAAATRRLREELGFETTLEKIFDFVYKADFDNGLTEYEFDHVYVGYHDGGINPDTKEVSDYVYMSMQQIEDALQTKPAEYTAWFHIAFPKVLHWWKQLQPAS
ncbi:MAG: isopentenyl-diphosphate Delta-isomerase [Chitinophagaceae bacterium]|nr:MAG: isopentenyl-diphosphate Delta-isomerase [Chitinophagaceae bacterium]